MTASAELRHVGASVESFVAGLLARAIAANGAEYVERVEAGWPAADEDGLEVFRRIAEAVRS